jgi:RHS repeat-associated protein
MEVFAKYVKDATGPDADALVMALASMATGAATPGAAEGAGTVTSGTQPGQDALLPGGKDNNGKPEAYLNYILYDTLFNLLDAGFIPVSEAAEENGGNIDHERLFIEKVSGHDGYLQAFVSNDSEETTDVYFDDMTMSVSSTDQLYFVSTDHLGSTRALVRDDGTVMARYDYNPWGELIRSEITEDIAYQYTGQENDKELGLLNFRARFYDAELGRFYGVDPQGQFASPFSFAGNNPVMYVDPDGEFITSAFLGPVGVVIDAALWGAVIGAGTSAAVYATTTAISGNQWDWGQFGNSVALGAVSGAVGGGIGGAFANSAFAQTVGFNLLNNSASTVAGSAILGGDITPGIIAGSVVGGFLGSTMPTYTGVKGGALANIGAEIGYNAFKGAFTGAYSGVTAAAIDGTDLAAGFVNGIRNGAIGGATITGLNILSLGHTVKLDQEELDLIYKELGTDFKNFPTPVFRKGWLSGSGATIGRNISHHMVDDESPMMGPIGGKGGKAYNYAGFAHELKHYQQMSEHGIGSFYARILGQYLKSGYRNAPFEKSAYRFGTKINNVLRLRY